MADHKAGFFHHNKNIYGSERPNQRKSTNRQKTVAISDR
jgi:hypothetical protein